MTCNISFRDVAFTPAEESVTITATTDIACHLFCRLTIEPPRIHTKSITRRGEPFMSELRFCFTVFEDNEQEEAGDTMEHTWIKPAWPVCTTKYFYLFGSQDGIMCVSTSPVFCYHNQWKPPPPPYFLYTKAAGDETNIYYVYPPGTAHWLAVHDLRKNANSWGVNTRYYMRWERDLYRIDPLPPGTFDTVKLRCWGGQTYGYHQAKYALKMPGYDVWESGPFGWSAAGSEPPRVGWVCVLTSNPITGMPWSHADFDNLQLGVTLCEIGSFGYIFINYIYIELINYVPS